jgi:hypothetical protein
MKFVVGLLILLSSNIVYARGNYVDGKPVGPGANPPPTDLSHLRNAPRPPGHRYNQYDQVPSSQGYTPSHHVDYNIANQMAQNLLAPSPHMPKPDEDIANETQRIKENTKRLQKEAKQKGAELNQKLLQHEKEKNNYSQRTRNAAESGNVSDLLNSRLKELLKTAPQDRSIDVSKIPNPSEGELPYHFKSPVNSEFREEIVELYKNLYKIQPKFGKQVKAKEYGLISVEEADKSFSLGDGEQANFYKNLARDFLDIAVGIDPITGVGRSAYELFIGRNLITGVELNNYERGFAFLGVVTAGQSKNITNVSSGLLKIASKVNHLAPELNTIKKFVAEGSHLANSVSDIICKGWRKSHKIVAVHSSEHINQSFKLKNPNYLDPFQKGTKVVEFTTTKETKFVRVFQENNMKGGWFMKPDALRGLTADQIRKKFYLPAKPLNIVDIHVPKDYSLYRGHVGEITEYVKEGSEGAIQYFSKEFLPEHSFKNVRKLEGIFK